MKNLYSLLLACLLMNVCTVNAQITISEYSASNMNQFPDNNGKYEDWIEIKNTTDIELDISGWAVSDKPTKPLKWQFPAGTTIEPQGYLVVWCSGRDMVVGNNYHSNFKLTQTKGDEYVQIARPDESIVESYPLQLTLLGHSRVQNEPGVWAISTSPTPRAENKN